MQNFSFGFQIVSPFTDCLAKESPDWPSQLATRHASFCQVHTLTNFNFTPHATPIVEKRCEWETKSFYFLLIASNSFLQFQVGDILKERTRYLALEIQGKLVEVFERVQNHQNSLSPDFLLIPFQASSAVTTVTSIVSVSSRMCMQKVNSALPKGCATVAIHHGFESQCT